ALDDGDPPPLEQALHALPRTVDDLVAEGVDPGHVDAVEGRPHPESRGLARLVGHLGRVQERLGGDAPPVQAGTADLVFFDQRDRLAEFGRPQSAGITAAATTQHDDVIRAGAFSHWKAPCRILDCRRSRLSPPNPDSGIFSFVHAVCGRLARPAEGGARDQDAYRSARPTRGRVTAPVPPFGV